MDDMPTNDDGPKFVPLEPGLSLRFHEAVLFQWCLKEVKYQMASVREPEPDDLESDVGKSSRESFRCFVNKLAQICDNELRGKTVTAFAVLQPGEIQYWFASNQRSSDELEQTRVYIADILRTLGTTPDDQLDGVYGTLLDKIVAFNRPVLKEHIKNLTRKDNIDHCAKVSEDEGTAEAQEAARNLQSLAGYRVLGEKATPENFAAQTRELLETIDKLYNSPFEGFFREKARADRDPTSKTPWSEVRHAFSRLQSYNIAVRYLISMRRRRHELFDDPVVVPVPSSARCSCPNLRRTVDGILKRFPEKLKIAEAYNAYIPDEQKKLMTGKIKMYANGKNDKFKPYVHAELVLLDAVLSYEQREGAALRFFAEADFDRYIGCSKPTCRLCKLYVDNHPSGVEFRASHGNIYHEWRAPDILDDGGVGVEEAKKARQKIHDKMLEALRQMIKRTITENVAERKQHDSNSSPTSYIGEGSSTYSPHLGGQAAIDRMDSISTRGAMDDSEDVSTTFGRLTLGSGGGESARAESSTPISGSSRDTTPHSA
ncbi:hypothetical protein B0T20DRAFT_404444 [Sordaria brevicollis]|uniref:Uncharacterized protein n=1 Tax=Sordaria brevicollis TaxID=83679 RepID=A0AAE0PIA6_SORBR|nr:hypothetical protein B0T20DRAFT_404444 [Sordaria brevicollis]